jgi:hypothetical protein
VGPSLPRQFCPAYIINTRGYDFREGQGLRARPSSRDAVIDRRIEGSIDRVTGAPAPHRDSSQRGNAPPKRGISVVMGCVSRPLNLSSVKDGDRQPLVTTGAGGGYLPIGYLPTGYLPTGAGGGGSFGSIGIGLSLKISLAMPALEDDALLCAISFLNRRRTISPAREHRKMRQRRQPAVSTWAQPARAHDPDPAPRRLQSGRAVPASHSG